MAKKMQINLEDTTYSIIKRIKPRAIKLFVSIAIERFAKTEESKLFFKESEIIEEKITKIPEKNNEAKKNVQLEEWD